MRGLALERIILIGLSGTGKSSLARLLATRLRYACIDVDEMIADRFHATIPQIFAQYGESVFRTVERECLVEACDGDARVIATGGGVVTDEDNWLTMRAGSLIIHLRASPDEMLMRLRGQIVSDPDARRPLLESDDPRAALDQLWQARRHLYDRADVTIDTTGKDLDSIAREIEIAMDEARVGSLPTPMRTIGTPGGRSDLFVAPGLIGHIGRLARKRFPAARRAWVVTDSNVGPLWSPAVCESLKAADFGVSCLDVPAGESSKSLDCVSDLLDQLLDQRIDRRDIVVALGGGVIGDLAGFVASIALRGVGLVQVPTSLLAMVDSSVGGKTGINHARGKNLIGAFYQPQLVLADPQVLETLPERELRGGWGEIIKHSMIEVTATGQPETNLLTRIESASDEQLLDVTFLADIVQRNVLIKSMVVQADERESGIRRVLNYGHTLGHAMEAAGYQYHHGEAIALGMRAAADIAIRVGRSTGEVAQRQNSLLDRLGLPSRFDGDLRDVMDRLMSDKKAVHGQLTWILPTPDAGSVDIVTDVPSFEVEAAAVAIGAQ